MIGGGLVGREVDLAGEDFDGDVDSSTDVQWEKPCAMHPMCFTITTSSY